MLTACNNNSEDQGRKICETAAPAWEEGIADQRETSDLDPILLCSTDYHDETLHRHGNFMAHSNVRIFIDQCSERRRFVFLRTIHLP